MQREVVADIFDTMELLETERCDERQFHIEDAVFVIGGKDKIAVGEAGSLLDS